MKNSGCRWFSDKYCYFFTCYIYANLLKTDEKWACARMKNRIAGGVIITLTITLTLTSSALLAKLVVGQLQKNRAVLESSANPVFA